MSNSCNIWITRPAMDGEKMAKLAREQGLVPWQMPVMDIFWLMPDKVGLRALTNASVMIVTSRHALTSLDKANVALPQNATWFAIGKATAEALTERGIQAHSPKQTDSEGLLHELEPKLANGQQAVILKGEGGRTLLSERLQVRGLLVAEMVLYRRICKPVDGGMLATFLMQNNPVLSVASGETLTCLIKSASVEHARQLVSLPLIVMSERVAQFAQDKGWRGKVVVAQEASSAGLIEAVKFIF